jgi:hypothetical protein
MVPDFTAAVSALAYSIMAERCGDRGDGLAFPHNRVVRTVLAQHAALPDYLRGPLRWLTLGLDASTIPTTGRPFHALEHARRWRRVERWRASRLGPLRDLVRFYESLAIFGWYDEQGSAGHGR